AWTRLTTVPIHLANGQVIPKNTMVAYCNPRFDPSVDAFENPEEFDGLRFLKLAQSNGPQVRYKLDSLSTDSLGFGYGIHACPGRSFAVAELKLIVAHLIQNYDLKLKDGQDRPENIFMDFQIMPDPKAEVLLRARKF
ncbi:cytochrome P450, partial [Cladorrhinum samala]